MLPIETQTKHLLGLRLQMWESHKSIHIPPQKLSLWFLPEMYSADLDVETIDVVVEVSKKSKYSEIMHKIAGDWMKLQHFC